MTARTARVWLVWVLVIFGLMNLGVDHQAREQILSQPPTSVGRALGWFRCYLTDDIDTLRYQAYANAVLGRPCAAALVRSWEQWQSDNFHVPPEGPELLRLRQPDSRLLPYRDFLVEYPPGAFLFCLPPALLVSHPLAYRTLFSWLMGGCLTLAVALCGKGLKGDEWRRMLTFCLIGAAALGTVCVRRLDAGVALLICASLRAHRGGRGGWAGGLLAVAAATKVLPALLLPVMLRCFWRDHQRSRARHCLMAFLAVLALMTLPVLPWLQTVVDYHQQRPLHLESSAGAGLALLQGGTLSHSFGASGLVGPSALLASGLSRGLLALALLWLWFRPRPPALEHQCCQVLAALMVLGPVFSPQFLVWLLAPGCRVSLEGPASQAWLWVAVLGLTQAIWPLSYGGLMRLEPASCALVLLRNGLLACWAVRWSWLAQPLHCQEGAPEAA